MNNKNNNLQKINFDGFMIAEVLLNIDPECEGKIAVFIPRLMFDNNFHETPYEKNEEINSVLNTDENHVGISNSEDFNNIDPEIKNINYFWLRPTYMFESGLMDDKWENNNLEAIQNSGNYKVPRIGSKIFAFFLDKDPQKGFYLPFSPTLPTERIGDKEASRNWVRQFEVDNMIEKLKTYDNNYAFNKTDILDRLSSDLQEVINSVGLYNQPNQDYSAEPDGEYKSFLARAARQVNVDVLRSYYNGCRLEVDTNKNDECIILSAGGPGYEKENGSSGVDGFGSDLAFDTFKDMDVERIDIEMDDPPSDSYYAVCPPMLQKAHKYKNSIRIYQDERGIVINGDVTINGNIKIRGKEDLQQDLNIGGDVYCIKFVKDMEDYEIGDKTYELDGNGNKVIDKETNKYKIKVREEVDPNKSLAIYWTRTVDPKLFKYKGTENHQEYKVITINTPENAMFHNDVSLYNHIYSHINCTENYMFNGLKYTEDGNEVNPTIYKNKDNPYVNNLTYRDKIEIMKLDVIGSRYDERSYANHNTGFGGYFNHYNAIDGVGFNQEEDRVDRVKLDAFHNTYGNFDYSLNHQDRIRLTLNSDINLIDRNHKNIGYLNESETYLKNSVDIESDLTIRRKFATDSDINVGNGALVSDTYIKNPCLLKEYVLDKPLINWESYGDYPDQMKNHDGLAIKAIKAVLATEEGKIAAFNVSMAKMQYQFNIIYSYGITKPDVALFFADWMNQFGSYSGMITSALAAVGPNGTLEDALAYGLGGGFATRRLNVYSHIIEFRDKGYLDEITGPNIDFPLTHPTPDHTRFFQEAKPAVENGREPTLPHILLKDMSLINRNICNSFYRQSEYTDQLEGYKRYKSVFEEDEILNLKDKNLLEEFPDSLTRVAVFITSYFENGRGSQTEMSGDPEEGCSFLTGCWGNHGNVGNVIPLDVNAITVSLIGLHADSVRQLLHLIYEMNPEKFDEICAKYNDKYEGVTFHTNFPNFQLSNGHDDDYQVNDSDWEAYRVAKVHDDSNAIINYMRDNKCKDRDYSSGWYYPYEKDDYFGSCYNFECVVNSDGSETYFDTIPQEEKFTNSMISDHYKAKLEEYINSKKKGNIKFKSDGKILIEAYSDTSDSEGSSDAYVSFASKVLFLNDVYIGGKNEGTNYDRYPIRLSSNGDIQTRGNFAIKSAIHNRTPLIENALSNTEPEVKYDDKKLLDMENLKSYEIIFREYDETKKSVVTLKWNGNGFENSQNYLKTGRYNKSYMRVELITLDEAINIIKNQASSKYGSDIVNYTLNENKIKKYLNSDIYPSIYNFDYRVLASRIPYLNYDGTPKDTFYYKFYTIDNFIFRKKKYDGTYETLDTTKIKHFILDIDRSELVHNDNETYDIEDEILYEIPIFDNQLYLQESDNYLFKIENYNNVENNNLLIENFNKFELYNPVNDKEYYTDSNKENPKYNKYNNNILFSIKSNEKKYKNTETIIRTFKTKFKGAYLYSYDDHLNGKEDFTTLFNFYHNTENNKPEKVYMPDLDLYILNNNFVISNNIEIINSDDINNKFNTFGISQCLSLVNKSDQVSSFAQESRLFEINNKEKMTRIYYPNFAVTNRNYISGEQRYLKMQIEPINGKISFVADTIDIYCDNNKTKNRYISTLFSNQIGRIDIYNPTTGTHNITLHGDEGKVAITDSYYTGIKIKEDGYLEEVCGIFGHINSDAYLRLDTNGNTSTFIYNGSTYLKHGLYICNTMEDKNNEINIGNDVISIYSDEYNIGRIYDKGNIYFSGHLYATDYNFANYYVDISQTIGDTDYNIVTTKSILSKKSLRVENNVYIGNNLQVMGVLGTDYLADINLKSFTIYTNKTDSMSSIDLYIDSINKHDHGINGALGNLTGTDLIIFNKGLYLNGSDKPIYMNGSSIYGVERLNVNNVGNNGNGCLIFDTSTNYNGNSIIGINELSLTVLNSNTVNTDYLYTDNLYSRYSSYITTGELYSGYRYNIAGMIFSGYNIGLCQYDIGLLMYAM